MCSKLYPLMCTLNRFQNTRALHTHTLTRTHTYTHRHDPDVQLASGRVETVCQGREGLARPGVCVFWLLRSLLESVCAAF